MELETASEGQSLVNDSMPVVTHDPMSPSRPRALAQAVLAWTRIPFRISRKDWFK